MACRELEMSRANEGGPPWYLSCRAVAKNMKISIGRALELLQALQTRRVIQRLERGSFDSTDPSKSKASAFKYLLSTDTFEGPDGDGSDESTERGVDEADDEEPP